MDIEHSAIGCIQRLGYPDKEYLEWEMRQQEEAEEEEWPDGLRWSEWQKEKSAHSVKVNA